MIYFNDNEPFAGEWLRNLWSREDAWIDPRSVRDIRSHDVEQYERAHFFAGIGGWEVALHLAGWPEGRPVWTGSCPCQPFSSAGRHKGVDDDRHLWPEFLRLIGECRPPTIFGEQVASKDGRIWLAGVRADLEALGYAVGAADLCAAGVGAPHIRQRLYWVADAGHGDEHRRLELAGASGEISEAVRDERLRSDDRSGGPTGAGGLAHTDRDGRQGANVSDGQGRDGAPEQRGGRGGLADTSELRRDERGAGTGAALQGERPERGPDPRPEHARQLQGRPEGLRGAGGVADAADGGLGQGDGPHGADERAGDRPADDGGLGDAEQSRLEGHGGNGDGGDESRRLTADAGRPTAAPGNVSFWDAYDLLPCLDGKARRVEPRSFPLAHGVPARVGRIRAYGNAIVPQVAAEFIKAFLEAEQ